MVGDICPICSEGFLQERFTQEYDLITEYSVCSYCGSEIADAGQISRNATRQREWDAKYLYTDELPDRISDINE
jgi:DNA-directed RNA polymerase subunit RPC12/RpoP